MPFSQSFNRPRQESERCSNCSSFSTSDIDSGAMHSLSVGRCIRNVQQGGCLRGDWPLGIEWCCRSGQTRGSLRASLHTSMPARGTRPTGRTGQDAIQYDAVRSGCYEPLANRTAGSELNRKGQQVSDRTSTHDRDERTYRNGALLFVANSQGVTVRSNSQPHHLSESLREKRRTIASSKLLGGIRTTR